MPSEASEYLTISQVAGPDWLNCSDDTVRRMIARGELKAVRIGPRLIRIRRADLLRAMRPVTKLDMATVGGDAA